MRENGKQIIDLKVDGLKYIAARGGVGGLGNRYEFGVSFEINGHSKKNPVKLLCL